MNAAKRIEELLELAPRYTEAYNKVYKTPGHKSSRTCPDCQELELISGELEELLACGNCGAGGIEDARYTRDNSPGECEECVEFADLWDLDAEELDCYNWEI
jgi:hypothetical protein